MKIDSWRLRGVVGALSLIIVGGFLGILTHHFVLGDERFVESAMVGAHRASRPHMTESSHEVISDFSAASEHVAVGAAFREVLQLNDDQAAAIHEILIRHQSVVDESWESLRSRVHEEVDRAHEEIRALLSPAQQERFEAWLDRHVRSDPNGDLRYRRAH
jgi:hypothetical protein